MLVVVAIRGNDFRNRSHQRKLPDTTDATGEIYETVKRLFSELWDGRTLLRLLGVSLTDLTHGEAVQMSLFEDEKRERFRKLDRAVDAIRDKFGADTIMRAGAMESGKKVGHKHKAQIEMGKENNG